MSDFKGAWYFLTIIRWGRTTASPSSWSVAWFAVIGTVIGWLMLAAHGLMWARVPLAVEAALLLVGLVVMSGALHLDGLADTCDALYAGDSKEEALRIMKDPHIGTMGVVGIGLVLLVKWASLWALAAHRDPMGLLLIPACGRAAMALTMASLPYVGSSSGVATPFLTGSLKTPAAVTIFWMVMLTVAILQWQAIWFLVAMGLILAGSFWMLRKRLGGFTGDAAGAVGEIIETASFAMVAAITCGRL